MAEAKVSPRSTSNNMCWDFDTTFVALTKAEQEEAKGTIDHVLKELAINAERIPAEPLEGEWV